MPTILKETYPTAKKEHICEFCGYKIPVSYTHLTLPTKA